MEHAQGATAAAIHGDDIDPLMVPLYRRASAEQKLAVVARLNGALIALKEGQLAAAHPDWLPERRKRELRSWWLGNDER